MADNADMLATMRQRLTMAQGAYTDSRNDELDDLRFLAGSPDNQWQWPRGVLATRGASQGADVAARPCLTINKLPQHVRQVTNEQRQNRPAGKVIPVDDNADVEMAEVFDGMVRHIEYISDADVAYDTACDNQVTYGEGYIRLLTEYVSPESFEQDIKIGRVRNSFSVFMDPMIQDPCGSDAEWCFITQDMLKPEYERLFPNAKPITSLKDEAVGDQGPGAWLDEDTVRIAEYFYIEHKKATLNLWPDGTSIFADDPRNAELKVVYGKPLKTREADRRKVCWIKTNGYEVLEECEWAGKYIPVVRVVGNEFEVEGRLYVSGLVRNAKDAQRMYNYWVSQEAEMLALAPKAPFIGYGGQFEGYENQWKTANQVNWPYLEVNADVMDGKGGVLPLPQRAAPPLPQAGLIQAKMGAADDIKSTTGQYDSSLGQNSQEVSGRAILAREKQGDVGTFHYADNLGRAIRYITRQIVDLIPKIYDTQRVARIIGLDSEVELVKIDPNQQEAVKKERDENGAVIETIYNPGVGTYDVMVTTGPSYMTKRQEAADAMGRILASRPELWTQIGDLAVKAMDWDGHQEMAERLKRAIDPRLLGEEDESPGLMEAKKKIELLEGALKEQLEGNAAKELEIKEYDAETKRISALSTGIKPEEMQVMVYDLLKEMMESGDLPAAPGLKERQQAAQQPPEGPEGPMMPPMMGGPGPQGPPGPPQGPPMGPVPAPEPELEPA